MYSHILCIIIVNIQFKMQLLVIVCNIYPHLFRFNQKITTITVNVYIVVVVFLK